MCGWITPCPVTIDCFYPVPPSVFAPRAVVMQTLLQSSPAATQNIVLQWPGASDDVLGSIYYTEDMTPPVVWTRVTSNAPVFSNGLWTVTLPKGTNASGFYQLR